MSNGDRFTDYYVSLPSRECGLKSEADDGESVGQSVTPLAGVWIEMMVSCMLHFLMGVTPLAGVWIEIMRAYKEKAKTSCHSPRGSVD